jgi:hypothetical protein
VLNPHPLLYLLVAIACALLGADHLWSWSDGGPPRTLYLGVLFLLCVPMFIFSYVRAVRRRKLAAAPE